MCVCVYVWIHICLIYIHIHMIKHANMLVLGNVVQIGKVVFFMNQSILFSIALPQYAMILYIFPLKKVGKGYLQKVHLCC